MTNKELGHVPVLLREAVEALEIKPDGLYVDGTFGRGGHSQAVLARLGKKGQLLVFDKDPAAIASAKEMADERVQIMHHSFAHLSTAVEGLGWCGKVDGILLDLGVSSPQIDDPTRGFSFMHDGPLDMRMDPSVGISAADWLQTVPEEELANVLWEYGDERFSRKIAAAIVYDRQQTPFTSTKQLAEMIARVVKKRDPHKHPATRSFQAIRIAVNKELDDLRAVLAQSYDVLSAGGKLCAITFHSLEDRLIKKFFNQHNEKRAALGKVPVPDALLPRQLWSKVTTIKPSRDEIIANPRARSAKLRVASKEDS